MTFEPYVPLPAVLYHGTTTDNWALMRAAGRTHNTMHLTDERAIARHYAELEATMPETPGTPLVLAVDVSRLDPRSFECDTTSLIDPVNPLTAGDTADRTNPADREFFEHAQQVIERYEAETGRRYSAYGVERHRFGFASTVRDGHADERPRGVEEHRWDVSLAAVHTVRYANRIPIAALAEA